MIDLQPPGILTGNRSTQSSWYLLIQSASNVIIPSWFSCHKMISKIVRRKSMSQMLESQKTNILSLLKDCWSFRSGNTFVTNCIWYQTLGLCCLLLLLPLESMSYSSFSCISHSPNFFTIVIGCTFYSIDGAVCTLDAISYCYFCLLKGSCQEKILRNIFKALFSSIFITIGFCWPVVTF